MIMYPEKSRSKEVSKNIISREGFGLWWHPGNYQPFLRGNAIEKQIIEIWGTRNKKDRSQNVGGLGGIWVQGKDNIIAVEHTKSVDLM